MMRLHDVVKPALQALALITSVLVATTCIADVTHVSDFEDLNLPTNSYWNGSDGSGGFTSGNVAYVNRYNETYSSWNGFAYSSKSDTTTPGFGNQYSAVTGQGYDAINGGTYGVAYASGWPGAETFLDLPDHAKLESAFITNTTFAFLSMTAGDSFAKKFGGLSGSDEDWFKLTLEGEDADGNMLAASTAVEFMLADYRFTDNSQDYIVDEWTAVDLTSLDGAKRIYFSLSSSDNDPLYGMNTPAFFAMDNVTYSVVPEPSTLLLALIGGVSFCIFSNWRRRGKGVDSGR